MKPERKAYLLGRKTRLFLLKLIRWFKRPKKKEITLEEAMDICLREHLKDLGLPYGKAEIVNRALIFTSYSESAEITPEQLEKLMPNRKPKTDWNKELRELKE